MIHAVDPHRGLLGLRLARVLPDLDTVTSAFRQVHYKYPAPRIDYVLIKNSPGSWRYGNQLVLSDGRFDPAYQGSDHNLQWAEVGIR